MACGLGSRAWILPTVQHSVEPCHRDTLLTPNAHGPIACIAHRLPRCTATPHVFADGSAPSYLLSGARGGTVVTVHCALVQSTGCGGAVHRAPHTAPGGPDHCAALSLRSSSHPFCLSATRYSPFLHPQHPPGYSAQHTYSTAQAHSPQLTALTALTGQHRQHASTLPRAAPVPPVPPCARAPAPPRPSAASCPWAFTLRTLHTASAPSPAPAPAPARPAEPACQTRIADH